MAKRAIIQTIQDGAGNRFYLPPRKPLKFQDNLILRFVIPGVIPSKKNNVIPDPNRMKITGIIKSKLNQKVTLDLLKEILKVKPFIRNSEKYKAWEDATKQDLILQAARWAQSYKNKRLVYPITKGTISIYHYWADHRIRDNSNKAESIHDALVACGILSSDSDRCLYKFTTEAGHYDIPKHLTTFTITAHEW